jgi:hypothetical protein
MAINLAMSGGHVDAIVRNGDALVAVNGWCADIATFDRGLRLKVAGTDRPPSHVFRVPRPDVDGTVDRRRGFTGAVAEWVVEPLGESCDAVLLVEGRAAVTLSLPAGAAVPYSHLHLHAQVVGREGIYGFGPPSPVVSDEVLQLARTLPPPVLDFGCGAGALVRALRRRGIEAYGLELDADRIRDSLFDEVRPFVTLYDGALPSPFATRQFASVVCSEVLEHIPGPEAALAELVRLASTALMITVPDMSAIPRGFPHGVVPWHLLESTHVNFFTQHSLLALLAPYTADVEVSRLGLVQCDRLSFYDTLATVARLDGKRADHAMGA